MASWYPEYIGKCYSCARGFCARGICARGFCARGVSHFLRVVPRGIWHSLDVLNSEPKINARGFESKFYHHVFVGCLILISIIFILQS